MKTLEAWYGTPPDRAEPVVQLFLAGEGPQWGEVSRRNGRLVLEIYPAPPKGNWQLPLDELTEVMKVAAERLKQ